MGGKWYFSERVFWRAFLSAQEENCEKLGSRDLATEIWREQNCKQRELQMQNLRLGSP